MYQTKDSGERRVFDSGMQRDTEGDKPRFDLTFQGPMLERWAWLLYRGALKYDANNWMKAAGPEELERFLSSGARHFAQWMYFMLTGKPDGFDEETGEPIFEDHGAAVFFNINGAEYVVDQMKREAEVAQAQEELQILAETRLDRALVEARHDESMAAGITGEHDDAGDIDWDHVAGESPL